VALKKGLYRGFSSVAFELTKSFKLVDIQEVKNNLLNHIFTRRGDRVMQPEFGTSIPDLVFEPMDEIMLETLRDELEEVFNFDPRVTLLDLQIIPYEDENRVQAIASLRYIELNLVDDLDINIEFREQF